MAYAVDSDVPAILGKEALGTLGGHLDFRKRVLTLKALVADIPLEMNAVGLYLLNVADFPESKGAPISARGLWRAMTVWPGAMLFLCGRHPGDQDAPGGSEWPLSYSFFLGNETVCAR